MGAGERLPLAKGKGVGRETESEGSLKANARVKVHELDLRQSQSDELPEHNEIQSRQGLVL